MLYTSFILIIVIKYLNLIVIKGFISLLAIILVVYIYSI